MHSNRLIHEKSPYLLQHAHNPVDWHAWGPEAFAQARSEDKPIFLSVGYSTCHWCHVMERESFENEEIAEVLNRYFLPIKVDREERPDVDRIYMTFVQATTGSGGWPMSVWLTPDLKPFFGGTYFPPDSRYGRPGFRSVLERIAEAWRTQRQQIVESSEGVLSQLQAHAQTPPGAAFLTDAALDSGFYVFRRTFDTRFAGFGDAPKFPRPVVHNFLLRYYHRTKNQEALDMALQTLQAMARGGMHDHLGGGFHRYSVDAQWFVPHFEKMLYDQAQLAVSYIEAFQITGEFFYAEVARDILDCVLRDMTHPDGGFYSAEDADSTIDPAQPDVKGEGAFYLWTKEEIDQVLGAKAAELFCRHYGVEENGNVKQDPQGEFTGKNILFEAHAPEAADQEMLAEARRKLLAARSSRIRPHRDDKILTAWNGLMISAFAKAAGAFGDPRYLEAAQRAAGFIVNRMCDAQSAALLRRFRDGDAAIPAFLDDYAFFVQALLDLYEADFNFAHIELALKLTERQRELFEDAEQGAFFTTVAEERDLLMRLKDDYDGAEPSGNSVAILNLLRLAQIANRGDFRESAEKALRAFAASLLDNGAAVPQMLAAYDYSRPPTRQIILVGSCEPFLGVIHRRFLPRTVVLLVDSEKVRRKLARYLPVVESMTAVNGKATAYVCENYACQLPTTEIERFIELLQ
jgi:uncharacterized protein YyaL (SSP411 family)